MPKWGFPPVVLVICLCSCFLKERSGVDTNSTNGNGSPQTLVLRKLRLSTLDLELGGDLAGLPAGEDRFLTREDLLALPQVTYTVSDDANFTVPTKISGVLLEEINKRLSAKPQSDLVVALCSDRYQANYTQAYMSAHKPVLVLLVNDQPPAGWPKNSEGHNRDMGPYMITHQNFIPSFHVLSNPEEAQIPWGVVRLEFQDEQKAFAGIAPRGPQANSEEVQAGYRIAEQHCFRCHNQGTEGGQKAGRPWGVLSTWATAAPEYFRAYVHDPKSKNPHAQMPGNPSYNDATLLALVSYFRTFSSRERP